MASLHDLHRALFPTARPLGATELTPERAEREVGWVRVLKPRVPAFEALETGDLAIIPGAALAVVAQRPAQIEELAVALARARVPAVLLVEGETGGDALDALGAAVTAAGLTALHLGRVDPVALERSVIGFLVNRRAELDRRAADLESQLARFALLGRGLDMQAATIGSFLGRAVVIEGRRGDPIAVHAPGRRPVRGRGGGALPRPAVRRGARCASRSRRRPASRAPAVGSCCSATRRPTSWNGSPRTGSWPCSPWSSRGDAAVRQARDETRRGEPLPADGPPWVVMLASQGAADGPDDIAAREETRGELRLLMSPAPAGAARQLGEPGAAARRRRTRRTTPLAWPRRSAWRRSSSGPSPCRGPSPSRAPAPRPRPPPARHSRPPTSSLRRRPWLEPRACPPISCIGNVRNLPDGARQARELLDPILVGRPEVQRERLDTLRAVLGSPSLNEAATRLGRPSQHRRLPGRAARGARRLGPRRPGSALRAGARGAGSAKRTRLDPSSASAPQPSALICWPPTPFYRDFMRDAQRHRTRRVL